MHDQSILSPKKYKTTRHGGKSQIAEKPCENCGALIRRPEGTSLSQFIRRKTCSQKCSTELAARNQVVNLAPKACQSCGSMIFRRDGESAGNFKKRKTCSDECRYAVMSRSRIALNKATPEEMRTPRVCQWCKSLFVIGETETVSDFRRRKTCSPECSAKLRGESRRATYQREVGEKPCAVCGTMFGLRPRESQRSFNVRRSCSKPCAVTLARENRLRTERDGLEKRCDVCGATMRCRVNEQPWAFMVRKTCSERCRQERKARTLLTRIDRAKPYPPEWNRVFIQSIRDRDGNICAFCHSGDQPSVHHVNYNKNDCRPENLITLCRSCHAKTNGGDRIQWTVMCLVILFERGVIDAEDFAA